MEQLSSAQLEKKIEAAFRGLLQPESLKYLIKISPSALIPQQKERLIQLYQHFIRNALSVSNDMDDRGALGDADNAEQSKRSSKRTSGDSTLIGQDNFSDLVPCPPPKKHRGRPRKDRPFASDEPPLRSIAIQPAFSTHGRSIADVTRVLASDAWGLVRRLSSLELEPSYRQHMEKNNAVHARETLNHHIDSLSSVSSNNEDKQLDGFKALLISSKSARAIAVITVISRVNYIFNILLVRDIAIFLYGKDDRGKDEQYQTMYSELKKSLELREGSAAALSQPVQEETSTELFELLKAMVSRGMRLVGLCDKFGTGSLFWLQAQLSDNFIDFRWTKKGNAYDAAMDHLSDLGLKEKADQSGESALGDAIRTHSQCIYRFPGFGNQDGERPSSENYGDEAEGEA